MASYYLTTPIYYASGEPHIGHAYTNILADVLARYRRRAGEDVLFLTGTDEHGQKIQEAAAAREVSPVELCDVMAGRFKAAWGELGISHDRFIRTSEPEHIAVVEVFLKRLYDKGLIYEAEYAGWYSVGQERYFTEKEIGPDRVDPIAGEPLQWIREKNYFFKMSEFRDGLVRHIEDNPEWIVPATRRNQVLRFLDQGLTDLSISRPRSRIHCGIPLPWDSDQVAYVWVDALISYVTASGAIAPGAPRDQRGFGDGRHPSRWPCDMHVMGKDIITTHAVYWPTLLMGADLPLPRRILAHGWWVVGDSKMSKSLGNVVDPLDLRERFGTDAVRWYLMREMPTGHDASYTPDRFLSRYDELRNTFGNLAHRTLSMVRRYREGTVPDAPADGLAREVGRALSAYRRSLDGYRFHEGFATAMDLARAANAFVDARKPWALARDPARAGQLDETLATLVRTLAALAAMFEPVMPAQARELASRLGLEGVPLLADVHAIDLAGRPLTVGQPLFPQVDTA